LAGIIALRGSKRPVGPGQRDLGIYDQAALNIGRRAADRAMVCLGFDPDE
jgi:hypothetical protein